ncbi:MAG: alpha-D-ribose 1-methylphosphonate 5-triphosphate diphosphatase [Candidatus Omnitrophica bacterium 4484_70.2]|nr:MAG: alpha-D-ribose 1-methylphosphonate 5-triphosphate diphosphatase [Candidatus Omnitrophica bacterium 4484_70.2]
MEKLKRYMKMIKIINSKIVTPKAVEDNKILLIEGERILDICNGDKFLSDECEVVDAQGGYIIPGLIDIHCDALEFKLSPRPNVTIPHFLALSYYEKELLSCGITTQFHGVYWGDVLEKHRSVKTSLEMIEKILEYRQAAILNHKIFIRFDIVNFEAKDKLFNLIKNRVVDLLSFQYHLPGQAQFKSFEAFKNYYTKVRGWREEELREFVKKSHSFVFNLKEKKSLLREISQIAREFRIPLVSHDDDKKEKIRIMKDLGVKISEFPVNLEAALHTKENNMYVVVGAPNVVRGKSSCGNVSALYLIKEKAADIICSDYHLPSMLYAVVKLYQEGILKLPEAVNMVTLKPAEAVGLKDRGAILPGKIADIVIFKLRNNLPEVNKVFIKGRCVYSYE